MIRARVVVAGQIPPPIGGETLMILRNLEVLGSADALRVQPLPFHFTRVWSKSRQLNFAKFRELFRVAARLIRLRLEGPIDCLIYPIGGPHLVPVLRDLTLLPLCQIMAKRVVLHIHAGGIAQALPTFPSPIRHAALWIYGRCSAAIVLTEFSRSDGQSLGVPRIEVVPNTLPDSYSPARADRALAGITRLLYIGHLCPAKGTPALLHAFASLRADHPDLRLSLVGEPLPPFGVEELQSMIGELGLKGLIDVRGVISGEEKWRCFGEADLLVFPAEASLESFPLVLLEGLMWALPIVATDWRSNAEILGTPPGGICYEIGPDTSADLRAALEQALRMSSQWPDWGAANRRRYLAYCDLPEEPLVACVKRILEEPA